MYKIRKLASAFLLCVGMGSAATFAGAPTAVRTISIPPGELNAALEKLVEQTGVQLLYDVRLLEGLKTEGVSGVKTPQAAIAALLKGTSLKTKTDESGAILISAESERIKTTRAGRESAVRLAQVDPAEGMRKVEAQAAAGGNPGDPGESGQDSAGIPQILVKGKRSLNTDIERTEDAPQPYVVFTRDEIERSQAVDLEEFLRTRLPMNASSASFAQTPGNAQTNSQIDLRGLGTNQTLILVDGRRLPEVTSLGSPSQPDINGIPLAAIERIEVLPSTASGIYGGSATGGVINIIMRRDYEAIEARIAYNNTFETDTGNLKVDLSGGFALEGGRTRVMVTATRSQANTLVIGDRDFSARAIALQQQNNPSNFLTLATPPLGQTVNIRGVGGALLVLKPQYGGTALGSAITHLPLGYAGPDSDNGAALVANAGSYNLNLPAGLLGVERGLMAAPTMQSASLNLRREMTSRVEAFLDLTQFGNKGLSYNAGSIPNLVSSLPATAPNNPFQQAIIVRFPTPGLSFESFSESMTRRGTAGVIARLPRNWMGEISYDWSRSRFYTAMTSGVVETLANCVLSSGVAPSVDPDGAGPVAPCAASDPRPALNALQEGNVDPIDFGPYLLPAPNQTSGPNHMTRKTSTLRLSGPVLPMPGGSMNLSALIEHAEGEIEDTFFSGVINATRQPSYAWYPRRNQSTLAYYLETRVPLVSSRNARTLLRELELQMSGRREEYRTRSLPTGALSVPSLDGPFPAVTYTSGRHVSTDYTFAVRYAPVRDLALRASFGSGFLPPSVTQIAPSEAIVNSPVLGPDPKRGNTPSYVGIPIIRVTGGTPDLKPERSESVSTGVIFTPRLLPGLRLSLDYTHIEKTDEIQTPSNAFLFENEDQLPGRIIRGENLPGDPADWAGPVIVFDLTRINIARTSVEAFDFQVDYHWDMGNLGAVRLYVLATRQTHYETQLREGDPVVERVGYSGGPLKWRGNAGFDWERGALHLGWNMQYYDSYLIYGALPEPLTASQLTQRATSILNQGSDTVPHQMYHDLFVRWRFDSAMSLVRGLLADTEIAFGIQNVFNTYPPILATSNPAAAGYSSYGNPRLRRYSVTLRKAFGK